MGVNIDRARFGDFEIGKGDPDLGGTHKRQTTRYGIHALQQHRPTGIVVREDIARYDSKGQ